MTYPYAMHWLLTEGDTEDWEFYILNPMTGEPRDLSGLTITLSMWHLLTAEMVITDAACTHDDTGGKVTYDTQTDDVDTPGEYQAQAKVVDASGKVKHYPERADGRWVIDIGERVESTDTAAS